ncbi:hypothetical protein ACFX13_013370 [Malus domestica]
MIVASSVGLLKKIDEAKLNKEKDVDYLSSIEVLVIDHAVVVTMQNWDFLKSAVEQLNRIPSKQHGTDVMRIRPWYLDGCAHFYRQTILLSYYSNPDINNLFSKHCNNYHGKVKLVHEHKGVLPEVILQVRQILVILSTHMTIASKLKTVIIQVEFICFLYLVTFLIWRSYLSSDFLRGICHPLFAFLHINRTLNVLSK